MYVCCVNACDVDKTYFLFVSVCCVCVCGVCVVCACVVCVVCVFVSVCTSMYQLCSCMHEYMYALMPINTLTYLCIIAVCNSHYIDYIMTYTPELLQCVHCMLPGVVGCSRHRPQHVPGQGPWQSTPAVH